MGALLYPAFFKISGYWYDLVRVDSMAYALAMWSAYFIMRQKGGLVSFFVGLFLGVLAHFTKQTAIFIPFLAIFTRVILSLFQLVGESKVIPKFAFLPRNGHYFRVTRPVIYLLLPTIIIMVNVWFFLKAGKFESLSNISFYLYDVGKHHVIYFDTIRTRGYQELWQYFTFLVWIIPIAVWSVALFRKWRPRWIFPIPVAIAAFAGYVAARLMVSLEPSKFGFQSGFASVETFLFVMATWSASMKMAIGWTIGGLVLWLVRWWSYRTNVRGLWWLGLILAAQYVAAVTWVKIGGYVNNYMPMFAVSAVVFGVLVGWMYRSWQRWFGPVGTVCVTAIIIAIFLPTWYGTRIYAVKKHGLNGFEETLTNDIHFKQMEQVEKLPWWIVDGLNYDRPEVKVTDPSNGNVYTGVPELKLGNQIPPEVSHEWGPKVLERISDLNEDGGVYLPHFNYLGHMAGAEIKPSVDSIRDISYLNLKTPKPLLDRIEKKEFKWIVLMAEMRYDWMTADMRRAIEKNYDPAGTLLPGLPDAAMKPVTGAIVKPTYLYKAK